MTLSSRLSILAIELMKKSKKKKRAAMNLKKEKEKLV